MKSQIQHYKVTDKMWRISLVVRISVVRWTHAQVKMAGGLEGFGDETGDLPLYLAGGGSAVCV